MAANRSASPYLLLTLAPFFWACNWIVGRGISSDIPPMAMTFFRWLFAAAMLAPFALPAVRRQWPAIRAHWRVLVLLGVIGIATHNSLAYLGLRYTTATNGVILNSFIPVMIVSLSWVFLRERLTPLQLAGVMVSLGGVLAILSEGSLATLLHLSVNGGDLFVVLSMLMWSIYTILLRWKPAAVDLVPFLFVIAVIGDVVMIPFWLGEMALGLRMHWTWGNLAALLAVSLFSSVLAYIFWNRGVAEVGASVAGLFVHLMPVFGIVLAWLVLGERLLPFHVAGIALILSGIWLTSRNGRRGDVQEAAAVGTD
ncbi:MAG: DMT family transporter [Burkholderiales bacterium]